MEDDVTRAIKQLETIAIKAMKSGYLDDAAKVMHIAEEIERVDKNGVGADAMVGADHEFEGAAAYEPADEPSEDQGYEEPGPHPRFQSLNNSPIQEEQLETLESMEQQSFDSSPRNVVPLNRFKMKRTAAVGDDIPEPPLR